MTDTLEKPEVDAKHQWWIDVAAELAKETDLSNFKNWQAVRGIPLYRDNEFHEEYADEVIDMLNRSPYKQEWFDIIKQNEPKLGHNEESWKQAQTLLDTVPVTGVLLKNAHHILTFEEMRGKSVLDYDTIVEIGSGIGEVARMILARGFKGKYHVVDFPAISRLAMYNNDDKLIPHEHISEVPNKDLKKKKVLLIATWSLSETPFDYRDEIGKKLVGCDSLILSQSTFKEIESNIPYFLNEWPKVNECFYRLKQLEFHSGDGGNMYIICARKP